MDYAITAQFIIVISTVLCTNEHRASLVVRTVKNLPAMQETWVQSLGQKDPLEKGMATHSSVDCSHEIKRHLLLG